MEEYKKRRLISLALAKINGDNTISDEEKGRLNRLDLAKINRDTTISNEKLAAILAAILLAAKGRPDFSIDDLLSVLDDDGPYAIRLDVSPPPSGNVSPAASPVASPSSSGNLGQKRKRDPKKAFQLGQKHSENNSGGKKTKKKGQRTHRRKKNTSRSLYTIK
jgi:hypothetical protein